MIPPWYAAIDNAWRALAPGGQIGVVDFQVAPRGGSPGGFHQGRLARHLWPLWFDHDGVRLNSDLLPYLRYRFETVSVREEYARLPYLPGLRVPYFVFVGRKAASGGAGLSHHVRTIFLSDIHLGTRACQADRLLSFLRSYRADTIFLVGDIIDFWAMQRSIHWTPAQNTVVQKILKRARHGVSVRFIPGNHDEALRDYLGIAFGDILIEMEAIHTLADGRRFLIIHGDEYDQVTRHHRWVAVMGDMAYNFLVMANGWLSRMRRILHIPGYWSLAGYAKRQVKSAVSFIFDFEDSVLHAAQQRGLDGVVCGHIHSATIREQNGVCYVNCGDWVDSCTAIVEHTDGRLELVHWSDEMAAESVDEDDVPPPRRAEPRLLSTPPVRPVAPRPRAEPVELYTSAEPSESPADAEPGTAGSSDWLADRLLFAPRLPEPAMFFAARLML